MIAGSVSRLDFDTMLFLLKFGLVVHGAEKVLFFSLNPV